MRNETVYHVVVTFSGGPKETKVRILNLIVSRQYFELVDEEAESSSWRLHSSLIFGLSFEDIQAYRCQRFCWCTGARLVDLGCFGDELPGTDRDTLAVLCKWLFHLTIPLSSFAFHAVPFPSHNADLGIGSSVTPPRFRAFP